MATTITRRAVGIDYQPARTHDDPRPFRERMRERIRSAAQAGRITVKVKVTQRPDPRARPLVYWVDPATEE